MRIIRRLHIWWLRQHLRATADKLEQTEGYIAAAPGYRDALTHAAAELRARIWFAENPRPAVGTTLRSLNGSARAGGQSPKGAYSRGRA